MFDYFIGNKLKDIYDSFLLLAVITAFIAIIVMLTFLSKRNEDEYDGFLKNLYDFLNFKQLTINAVLKYCYLFLAMLLLFVSISMLFDGGADAFLPSLVFLLVSEILRRLNFELSMLLVIGVTNLIEINKKINNKKDQDISFFEPDTDRYTSGKVKSKTKEQSQKIVNVEEETE